MGKSACAGLLRERGIPVIDTDDLARQVVEPGQPALAEIVAVFGREMLDAAGRLRRAQLARRVFADPAARRQLEQILHPRIRLLWRTQAEVWRKAGHSLAAIAIPLLFETEAQAEMDVTLCVACSAATQQQRLKARGWTAEESARRIAAQWPVEKKMLLADYVIWSEGSLELHAAQLDRILQRSTA